MLHSASANVLLNHKYFLIYNNPSFKYQHELFAVTRSFLIGSLSTEMGYVSYLKKDLQICSC